MSQFTKCCECANLCDVSKGDEKYTLDLRCLQAPASLVRSAYDGEVRPDHRVKEYPPHEFFKTIPNVNDGKCQKFKKGAPKTKVPEGLVEKVIADFLRNLETVEEGANKMASQIEAALSPEGTQRLQDAMDREAASAPKVATNLGDSEETASHRPPAASSLGDSEETSSSPSK